MRALRAPVQGKQASGRNGRLQGDKASCCFCHSAPGATGELHRVHGRLQLQVLELPKLDDLAVPG